MEYILWL